MSSRARLPVQSVAIVESACTPVHATPDAVPHRKASVRSSPTMPGSQLAHIRDLLESVAADRKDSSDAALLRAVAETVEHIRLKDEGQAAQAGALLAQLPPSAFRALLKTRRKAANLSLRQLAKLSSLAPNTIRYIENGSHEASEITASRLARVAELGLLEYASSAAAPRPNCWLLSGYDRRALMDEIQQTLSAPGGRLEQTSLYLDDVSAGDYLAIAGAPAFQERFRALPLAELGAAIAAPLGGAPLDLVALGPGDGRSEVELAKEILKAAPGIDMKVSLLDISHTLLTMAYARARAELPAQVSVEALHGDFRHIVRYSVLHRAAALRRRRCYVLLGGTLANVDSEVLFIRDGLGQSQAGDFAVVDFQLVWGDRRDPEALRAADPVLRQGPPELHARWCSGPLRRYGHDLEDVKVGVDLMADGAIEGSYELDFYADAVKGNAVHRFHLFRVRRYDLAPLLATFARLGWETERCWTYGPAGKAAVALLRRV